MARLPQTNTTVSRYLRQQKRVVTRLANSTPYALSGTSVVAPGLTKVDERIVAGTPGGSRVELDSAGLRKYAADGSTVQVDLTGDVAAFSGLITGSEIIAGTAGAARVELDSTGLRVYAADGTTVLLDTADAAMIRARGDNTALGADAQVALTTGTGDTAVGASAQAAVTSGGSNTAVGFVAQLALTTGAGNAAVGAGAQRSLTTGFNNTAVGGDAQRELTISIDNTAVGTGAQYYLTTGDRNTAVGARAQRSPLGSSANKTTTASYQTSIGPETGQSSPTQVDGITTIGYQATAGAANATSIGREARADHAGSIALGYQALTTQPNQVMVGPRDVEITDTTKGLVLVSPDGTRMRITSADDGGLLVNGTPIGGGGGGTTLFADPNADRLVFWDDSVGAFVPLTASTGLTLTGTDLTVRAATDAQTGIVELATTTEATTGTDTARATTPAGVKAALDARTASATVAGIVELATSAETVTGTDTVRATTPVGVKAAINAGCRAPAVTARTTANIGSINNADVVLVTAPSITGDGVKRFRITGFCSQIISAAADTYLVKIKADGAQIQTAVAVCTAGTQTNAIPLVISHVPTAGVHTYTFTAARFGAGSAGTAVGAPTFPIEIIVEQIA